MYNKYAKYHNGEFTIRFFGFKVKMDYRPSGAAIFGIVLLMIAAFAAVFALSVWGIMWAIADIQANGLQFINVGLLLFIALFLFGSRNSDSKS